MNINEHLKADSPLMIFGDYPPSPDQNRKYTIEPGDEVKLVGKNDDEITVIISECELLLCTGIIKRCMNTLGLDGQFAEGTTVSFSNEFVGVINKGKK
ncbi:hypothetical protein P4E94_19265 [Pontiellaceae bacterium B12219]|nr:hypothetical protein [Pontiellaceae bacterium B12219]